MSGRQEWKGDLGKRMENLGHKLGNPASILHMKECVIQEFWIESGIIRWILQEDDVGGGAY